MEDVEAALALKHLIRALALNHLIIVQRSVLPSCLQVDLHPSCVYEAVAVAAVPAVRSNQGSRDPWVESLVRLSVSSFPNFGPF